MSLFNSIFNKSNIYNMLFINVKTVLEHPTLESLKENNNDLFKRWNSLSKFKYNVDLVLDDKKTLEKTYQKNAIHYPEYVKVVAITYAKIYNENGTIKRFFKKISFDNEFDNIQTFLDILQQLSISGLKSEPVYFPILCGHDIISRDIPLLIKKYLKYRNELTTINEIPLILKRTLDSKPWESNTVIDVVNVWKFNGAGYMPLILIADFLGLKKTHDLMDNFELSEYYWNNYNNNPEKTIDFIANQSANQTNIVIQLMNELRQR